MKSSDIRLVIAGGTPQASLDQVCKTFPGIKSEACLSPAALMTALDTFKPTVAFITKNARLSPMEWRRVLDTPSLKWLQLGNIGYDHVPEWDRKRVKVTNSGGAGAYEMAEFVMAAILMVNAGMLSHLDNQRARRWRKTTWTPLREKTLAAVGVGNIGGNVVKLGAKLGMRVIAVRDSKRKTPGADQTLHVSKLHQALAQADYVSLQTPHNARTENLFDAAAFAHMKKDAWLINIGRGALVDDAALIHALRNHRIGGVVLDALRTEPLPPESPYWTLDNVVVTSHSSGEVSDFYQTLTTMFCENLKRFKSGKRLARLI